MDTFKSCFNLHGSSASLFQEAKGFAMTKLEPKALHIAQVNAST